MDDHTKDVIDMSQRTIPVHYRRAGFDHPEPECVYCGELAQVGDHVLPVVYANNAVIYPWMRAMLVIVPSCNECNRIAGGQFFDSILEKQEYIQDRLRIKYRRLLDSPPWSNDPDWESGFGPVLAQYLRSQDARRSQLARRVAWKLPSAILGSEIDSDR